jgi:hypothetical protein
LIEEGLKDRDADRSEHQRREQAAHSDAIQLEQSER